MTDLTPEPVMDLDTLTGEASVVPAAGPDVRDVIDEQLLDDCGQAQAAAVRDR